MSLQYTLLVFLLLFVPFSSAKRPRINKILSAFGVKRTDEEKEAANLVVNVFDKVETFKRIEEFESFIEKDIKKLGNYNESELNNYLNSLKSRKQELKSEIVVAEKSCFASIDKLEDIFNLGSINEYFKENGKAFLKAESSFHDKKKFILDYLVELKEKGGRHTALTLKYTVKPNIVASFVRTVAGVKGTKSEKIPGSSVLETLKLIMKLKKRLFKSLTSISDANQYYSFHEVLSLLVDTYKQLYAINKKFKSKLKVGKSEWNSFVDNLDSVNDDFIISQKEVIKNEYMYIAKGMQQLIKIMAFGVHNLKSISDIVDKGTIRKFVKSGFHELFKNMLQGLQFYKEKIPFDGFMDRRSSSKQSASAYNRFVEKIIERPKLIAVLQRVLKNPKFITKADNLKKRGSDFKKAVKRIKNLSLRFKQTPEFQIDSKSNRKTEIHVSDGKDFERPQKSFRNDDVEEPPPEYEASAPYNNDVEEPPPEYEEEDNSRRLYPDLQDDSRMLHENEYENGMQKPSFDDSINRLETDFTQHDQDYYNTETRYAQIDRRQTYDNEELLRDPQFDHRLDYGHQEEEEEVSSRKGYEQQEREEELEEEEEQEDTPKTAEQTQDNQEEEKITTPKGKPTTDKYRIAKQVLFVTILIGVGIGLYFWLQQPIMVNSSDKIQ